MKLWSFLWTVLVVMQIPWGLTIDGGSGKVSLRAALYTAILWIPVPDPCCVGRAASATHRKRFPESGGCDTSYFFLWYTSKLVPPGEKQQLSTSAPGGGICDCHLSWWWPWQTAYCAPSCREPKAAALEALPGTVLPFHDKPLICGYF